MRRPRPCPQRAPEQAELTKAPKSARWYAVQGPSSCEKRLKATLETATPFTLGVG